MGAMKLEEWTVMDRSARVDTAGPDSDIFCPLQVEHHWPLSNRSLLTPNISTSKELI